MGRTTLCVRAPDILQSALQLLRYRVRVLRGKETNSESDCKYCRRVWLFFGRGHGRRAIAPEERIAVDVDVVRRRLYCSARNQRRSRYLEGRSARPSDHGFKDAGKR